MKKYKVFIDENMPRQLAKGLNELQQPQNLRENAQFEIISVKDNWPGASDEDIIPNIGNENGILITQDYRIQTRRHQKELYIENGVGVLFFNPPSKSGFSYWEMVKQLVNRWEDIKHIIVRNDTPFAFRCSARTKFEKLE